QDPVPGVRHHRRGRRRGGTRNCQGERMSTPTADLAAAGVSIWLDDLSRGRIDSGNLAELIESRNVVGVTTNPTIFAGAITDKSNTSYDAQVAELAASGASAE